MIFQTRFFLIINLVSFCLYWVMTNKGGGRGETMDPRDIYLSKEAPTFENLANGLYYHLQTLR